MTTSFDEARVPALTLGWRLKMALGDMSATSMADLLGYSRQQLSRWMADKGSPPRRTVLAQWAMATGTDFKWLETGVSSHNPTSPDGASSADTSSSSDSRVPPTSSYEGRFLAAAA